MGLGIQNGALGAEHEQIKKVVFFLQNITDWYNWVQNITIRDLKSSSNVTGVRVGITRLPYDLPGVVPRDINEV